MRPAEALEGLDLPEGWHVEMILHRPPTATGGKFSVGYQVVNKGGKRAYLKALDFSAAFNHPDPARALQDMTAAYNFERDLLAKCKNRRLDRVVTPIADGTVKVPGNFGLLDRVSYLIFELASGDIRNETANWKEFDLAWSLRSLHHTAVGLQQLHSTGIAHQDLKPSNVLVFPEEGTKVTDLGRASDSEKASQVDRFRIPGDVGYAPPEQWYGWRYCKDFDARCIADLYLMGSLIFFYFATCSATQAIRLKISQTCQNQLGRDFSQDLPYIQQAFSEVLVELKATLQPLAGELTSELVLVAQQLCQPDPRRRGDPKIMKSIVPQYDLQPYISRFDRMARTVEMRIV